MARRDRHGCGEVPEQEVRDHRLLVRRARLGKPANTRGILFREQEAGYLAGWLAIKTLMSQKKPRSSAPSAASRFRRSTVHRRLPGRREGCERRRRRCSTATRRTSSIRASARRSRSNQIAQGSQVEFQVAGSCGLGALSAAKDKGLWGIGVDADQAYLGSHMLTSAMKRVDAGVTADDQAGEGRQRSRAAATRSSPCEPAASGSARSRRRCRPRSSPAEKVLEKQIATGKVKGIRPRSSNPGSGALE